MSLPFHPLAEIFPLIEGSEFDELVASIKAHGLRDPIVVHDGMVLDGRNRQRACEAADVDCVYHPLAADNDPLQFVLDKNLKRRHLSESQRAYAAAELARLSQGRPPAGGSDEKPANLPVKQSEAAAMFKVSERSVRSAAVVRDKAAPEVREAVKRGEISVSTAAEVVDLPKREQRELVAKGEKHVVAKAKQQRAKKQTRRKYAGPPVEQESQHDRDLRMLRGVWDASCESARDAFRVWLTEPKIEATESREGIPGFLARTRPATAGAQ